MQHPTERASGFGGFRRLFHLTKDLRFAQHHRVEASSDPEGMADGGFARQLVQVIGHCAGRQPVKVGKPVNCRIRTLGVAIDLGAVAGGQDRSFRHRTLLDQIAQRVVDALSRKRHPLANIQRGALVVEAKGEQRHGQCCGHESVPILVVLPAGNVFCGIRPSLPELQRVKVGVCATLGEQGVMCTRLYNVSIIHDNNPVGTFYGG